MNDKVYGNLGDLPCTVCKGEFFKKDLDNQGRCKVCAGSGLTPGQKQTQDFVQNEQMNVEKLKKLIREVLAEIEEEHLEQQEDNTGIYAEKECTLCHNVFVPRAPAQKVCQACRDNMKDTK